MNHMNTSGHCKCLHHKTGAIIIFLIGLVFFLGTTGTLSSNDVMMAWPILLMVLGLTRLMGGSCKCYTKCD